MTKSLHDDVQTPNTGLCYVHWKRVSESEAFSVGEAVRRSPYFVHPFHIARSGLNREVELGSHSELARPLLQVSTAGCPDSCLCDLVLHSCSKSELHSRQVTSHCRGHHLLNIYCSGGG